MEGFATERGKWTFHYFPLLFCSLTAWYVNLEFEWNIEESEIETYKNTFFAINLICIYQHIRNTKNI